MENMEQYVISVTAAAVICGAVMKLTSKFAASAVFIKMLCGFYMVITVASPWLELPEYDFAAYVQSFSAQAQEASSRGAEEAEEAKRTIIKQTITTYILDKAASMGMEITVQVQLREDDSAIPCAVQIEGDASAAQKQALQQYLEDDLGIGMEEQLWIG